MWFDVVYLGCQSINPIIHATDTPGICRQMRSTDQSPLPVIQSLMLVLVGCALVTTASSLAHQLMAPRIRTLA